MNISASQRSRLPLCALLLALTVSSIASKTALADQVDNFMLIDHRGEATELYYHDDAEAVVLLAYREDSDLVNNAVAGLQKVQAEFADANVQFFLLNPSTSDTRSAALESSRQKDIDLPILMDDTQLVARSLELTHSGEVLVIDPSDWSVVYRGPVSADPDATSGDYLREALVSQLSGESLAQSQRALPASYGNQAIDYEVPADKGHEISYAETIAPLLKEKCTSCHRPGGIGPWAMTNHQIVQGFAPMIRETVMTGRMPPWHADPHVNEFKQDLSLSASEKQTLVHWIEAGAPRGEGEDPLTSVAAVESEWEMGQPDLVVDLPEFEVPPTGVIDYQFFEVKNPLDRDVWVRAVQIAPGDRQALHHAIATFGNSSAGTGEVESGEALLQPQLMTYVPGNETYQYPEDTGVFLPAGGSFFTQMHYTTYGREARDQSRIGLYFADEAPEYVLRHYAILNLDISIPPNTARHEEGAYYRFDRDSVIYSLFPHAHYRGNSSRFSIRYPDGSEELLVSVPNYDFNWQRYFQLKEPVRAPEGSMLIHRTVYDNSVANDSNPDPDGHIRFGEQTWEEMLYGGVSFRYAEPDPENIEIDPMQYVGSLTMGYLDANMDGKVELDEMPERARQNLAMAFVILDKDKSGGLESEELAQLMGQMGGPIQ